MIKMINATRDAVWDATMDTTRDATNCAVWDATSDATRDAVLFMDGDIY